MLAGIKKFTARSQLSRLRKDMAPGTFQYPDALRSVRKILVVLPAELRELTTVKQFLPEIRDLFRSADITLLTAPGMQIADIFPRKGFNILTPSADQINWAGLARKSYLKFLQDYHFDVVIDLGLEASDFTASILLSLPQAVRIGRGNHLGCPYYNLQIKTRYLRDERNIYRSLLETLRLLIDGRPNDEKNDPDESADESTTERRHGVP